MWIETYIYKKKKCIIDLSALAADRGLSYGIVDKDRTLIREVTGERTVLFDPLFPGMAIDVKQNENSAEVRLNFPSGSYDIELYFNIIKDICRISESSSFFIEAQELEVAEIDSLVDYFEECSVEIIKILTSQLDEKKVTGLIVLGALNPFVIGSAQAKEIDCNIDNYALMINNAQRIKAVYGNHWSYIGGYRNICVYEAPAGQASILPLHPVPFLGGNMPRRCEYYVDIPGFGFFRYEDFLKEFRVDAPHYDGACIVITPDREKADDLHLRCGIDLFTGQYTSHRSMGRFIDWGEYHYGKVKRKHLDTSEINCYSHIAIFFEWCLRHGLLNDAFLREYSDIYKFADDDERDLRVYIRNKIANGGALGPEMFTEEGRRFAEEYYLFGKGGYASDVDATALKILGADRNSSEKFKGEPYLFLEYDHEYRSLLSKRIDSAWKKHCKKDSAEKDYSVKDRRMF